MIKSNLNPIVSTLIRFAIIALILVIIGINLPSVPIDNTTRRWFPENFKEVNEYKNFLGTFKSDAILIIAFNDKFGFKDNENSKWISSLSKKLIKLPHLENIYEWPLNVKHLKYTPNDHIYSLILTFEPVSYLNPNRPELINQVETLLSTCPVEVHIAGTGIIHKALNTETKISITRFLSIGLIILILFMILIVRNISGILATLIISAFGVIFLLASSYFLNIPMGIVMVILPVIILFYGTSNVLHIIFHHGNFKEVFIPCFLTTLSSSIGFSIFIFDPIPQLRDFAVLAAVGIWSGFLATLILFYPQNTFFASSTEMPKFLNRIAIIPGKLIAATLIIISIFFFLGTLKIKTDINSLSVLNESNQAIVDHHFIQDSIGNYIPLEYVVDIQKVKSSGVENWIRNVADFKEIGTTISYLDFPSLFDAQKSGYFNFEKNRARITFFIPVLDTESGIQLVNRIDESAKSIFQSGMPEVTGYVTLYGRIADELGDAFLRNLFYAFLMVFLILFLYLRNYKLFLASIIPNLFPILVITGLMGWLNITLDMVTVPIGCLILGIIVDDSIHFLYHYEQTRQMALTILKAGKGIFYTSCILTIGFAIFLFSGSPPVQYFGILSVTAIISALMGDLILLPYFIKKLKA